MQNDHTPTAYRYTNWAGGNDAVSCDSKLGVPVSQQASLCEPRLSADGTGVAIQGHQGRDGTWSALPATTAVCDASLDQSICGYYREFEEAGLPASVTLAKSFTMNMGRFREFCLAP